MRASTMNFATFSQITFAFTVTPKLLMQATDLRAGARLRRRPAAELACGEAADHDGAQRALK